MLIRTSLLRDSRWPAPLTVCACLASSALFEMFEWQAAVIGGQAADASLATHDDMWDTQGDMFCALIGATVSLLLLLLLLPPPLPLSKWHDRQLNRLAI